MSYPDALTTLDHDALAALSADPETAPLTRLWSYDGRVIAGGVVVHETVSLTGARQEMSETGNPIPVNIAWCRAQLKRWTARTA